MTDEIPPPGLPRWFTVGLRLALAVLLAYSVVGVLLAMAGAFRPVPVLGLATVVAAWLAWSTRPSGAQPPATRDQHLVAGLVVAGALAVTGWNLEHHAEHLIVDRDPGVYLTTARWLVDEGDLRVEGLVGPFADSPEVLAFTPGFSPRDDGALAPQFPHLLPVVAAAPGWLDPTLLPLVNPVIGGLALLCVYAAASTVARPLWAASAAGLTALAFPFVLMARDLYSEPLALTLLFGGIWVLRSRDEPRLALGLLAGGLLGATCMVRIDGLVSMVPLAAVFGAALRQSLSEGDVPRRRWLLASVGATAATVAIGVVDTRQLSPAYYGSDLAPRLPQLALAAAAAGAGAFLVSPWMWRTEEGDGSTATRLLRAMTAVAAAGLLGLFAWMALLRPSVEGVPELAADASGRVLDLLEPLSTLTYRWLAWYLGPVGVTVALVALVALAATALLRDRDRLSLALPGVVLTTTVLYLLSPNITPDHPWAMRRFLAVSIPGLLVAQGWGLDKVWSWRPRSLPAVGPAAAVLVVCATAFAVVDTTRPMREVEVGRGSLDAVEELCGIADEAPSAILLAPEALYNATLPKALRAWCGVPVAGAAPEITAAEVQRLADAWALEGRRLLVVSASGSPFDSLGGPVRDVSDSPLFAPEMTLTRRPERLAPDTRLVPGDGVLRLRVQEVAPRPAESAQPAGEESAGSS